MNVKLTINVNTGTGEVRIYYQNKDYLVVNKETRNCPISKVVRKALQIEGRALVGIIDFLGNED